MSSIDWSKAPDEATHAREYTGGCDFYRRRQGVWQYYRFAKGWSVAYFTSEADCVARPVLPAIRLSAPELSSGYDRVQWAEDLIRQLPVDHEGRNSWLMNYGDPVKRAADVQEAEVSDLADTLSRTAYGQTPRDYARAAVLAGYRKP